MTNPTLDIIRRRRSLRAYTAEPVSREALAAIVEAGQHAPNGSGAQDWHFSVVTEAALLGDIGRAAKDMAMHMGIPHLAELGADPNFDCLYGAPALVLVSGSAENPSAATDCACAVTNMLIAAESLGIGSCFLFFPSMALMGGDGERLRVALSVPDGLTVYSCACFGHAALPAEPAPPRRDGIVSWR